MMDKLDHVTISRAMRDDRVQAEKSGPCRPLILINQTLHHSIPVGKCSIIYDRRMIYLS